MTVTITPAKLGGIITPPPSKSQAHRLIIAAALAEGESVLSHVARSQDITATVACMEELGAGFTWEGDTLTVRGMGANAMSPQRRLAPPRLDCGESGSTLRFLIPVALAVRGGGVFTGRGRLMERPLKPYFDLFDEKNIFYEQRDGALTVSGLLPPGEYCLPGDVSSQFFTGLMLALPLLAGDSRVVSTSPLESEDYVELTREVMGMAGVLTDGGYIPGNQRYRPLRRTVEADWSQAGFWYAAQGLGSQVLILGLDPCSAQGDKIIVPYCERLGERGAVELDVSQCPDLVPPLAVRAAVREGTTHIVNAGRLRLKESDRLASVTAVLNALGARVEEGPDCLTIYGVDSLRGGVDIDCQNDHRIAMMAAVAATRCAAPITLTGAECVAKSYPGFWEDYQALGGQIIREG